MRRDFRANQMSRTIMTSFRIHLDSSCASHPLLPARHANRLPMSTSVSLDELKMFGYAAMSLQDATKPSVRSYQAVRVKAMSLLDLYGHVLEFSSTGITVNADAEITRVISEFVGIGVGLAVTCRIFGVNPNRFSRFIAVASQKRMDFEFLVGGSAFLVETRGTTRRHRRTSMIRAVGPKKDAPASAGFRAHAGVVTLYNQNERLDFATVVDPPGDGGTRDPLDELAVVLEYYHNVYRLTHSAEGLLELFHEWVQSRRAGDTDIQPRKPRPDERPIPRVRRMVAGVGIVGGTLYDQRMTAASVDAFSSFDEASAHFVFPTWLVGTVQSLDSLVAAGDWQGLLEFRTSEFSSPGRVLRLESGLVVVRVGLSEHDENLLRREFETLRTRARYER